MGCNKGFSLIELIIIVALLAALVGISMASYKTYTAKTIDATTMSDLRSSMSAVSILMQDLPDPGNAIGGSTEINAVVPGFLLSSSSTDFCFAVANHEILSVKVCTNTGSVGGYNYISGDIVPLEPGDCNCS